MTWTSPTDRGAIGPERMAARGERMPPGSRLAAVILPEQARRTVRTGTSRLGRIFGAMLARLEGHILGLRRGRNPSALPLDQVDEGIASWDAEGRLVLGNRRLGELLGERPTAGMSREAFLRAVAVGMIELDPKDRERWVRERLSGSPAAGAVEEIGWRDGRWLRLRETATPKGGRIALLTDITETKRHDRAMQESERRLQAIMAAVQEGVVTLDRSGRVEAINPAAAVMFGRGAHDGAALSFDGLLRFADEADATRRFAECRAELLDCGPIEMVGMRPDGRRFPAEVSLKALAPSERGGYVATVRDVSARKVARELILFQATHDPLTGLPNRRLCDDRLDHALRRARRRGEIVAVALLDVDRFKAINDGFGHAAGDRVLVTLSQRLRAAVRESDTVARMDGDGFIFLLPGLRTADNAIQVARKLLKVVRSPVKVEEHELVVTASLGISLFPCDGDDKELLLKHADTALSRAKARGRNCFELFDRSMIDEALARITLEAELRLACEREQLKLVYQPQIDVQSGRVVGFEALMRWRHPRRGPIGPATFIPLAEESGLIAPLGLWALRRACRDMAGWQKHLARPLRLAVNISPRQLEHEDLAEQIERVLEETGIAAEGLELELTETALLDEDERTTAVIARLRALGLGLALDDFGTGYSSLSHLRRYPIQRLKMDRSFVRDVTRNRRDAAVARAIIRLAQELGLGVVAEGVETEAQLALLKTFGCKEGQGYYLGRPIEAASVLSLLAHAA